MAIGPGKYDDACTMAAREVGMDPNNGGCLLIVINGKLGSGFSAQFAHPAILKTFPDLLEATAKLIRADMKRALE